MSPVRLRIPVALGACLAAAGCASLSGERMAGTGATPRGTPLRPTAPAAVAAALEALEGNPGGEPEARRILHSAEDGAEAAMLAAAEGLPRPRRERRVLLAAALARGAPADEFGWDEKVDAWLHDLLEDAPPRTRALLACARLRQAGAPALAALRRAAAAPTPCGAAAVRLLAVLDVDAAHGVPGP